MSRSYFYDANKYVCLHSGDNAFRRVVFNRNSDDASLIMPIESMWHIKYSLNIYETVFLMWRYERNVYIAMKSSV